MIRKMAVLALIFLLLLGGCSQPEPAAQVNGEDITMDELEEQVAMLKASIEASGLSLSMEENEEYLELLRGEALKMMVRERILMQDLKKNDITLDEEAAQEYVGMLKELYGEETYNSILASNGTDEKQFIRDFAYNQALQKLYTQVTTEVTVSDGEVRNLFDADPDSYVQGSASHILLKVDWTTASDEEKNEKLALARELIGRLDQGEDFAELAKTYSEDGSAENGGRMDTMFSMLNSPFVDSFTVGALSLKQGEHSPEPVESEFGYHIIRLDQRVEDFESLKENVRQAALTSARDTAFQEYVEQLETASEVRYFVGPEAE